MECRRKGAEAKGSLANSFPLTWKSKVEVEGQRPHKHGDTTNHDFCLEPQNQTIGD